MELQVKRINLTGAVKGVEFARACRKYLVKNFTNSDIYVSFESNLDETKAVKIAAGYAQAIVINENYAWSNEVLNKTIYIKGTGEVEVQQLCYQ